MKKIDLKRIAIVSTSLFLLALTLSSNLASALSPEQKRVLQSGVYYFNTDSDQCQAGSTGSTRGSNIFVIGDSLTVGMRDSGGLKSKLEGDKWTVQGIQAEVGDTVTDALGRIDVNRESEIKASDTVLVALGTNPENNFAQKINDMVSKIRSLSPNAVIYWMNAYTKVRDYSDINGTIKAQSATLNYSVIDWQAEATANPEEYSFAGDGIHLSANGYTAKADFTVTSLSASSSTSLVGADSKTQIWNFLLSKGLTPIQAAGVMGNMQAESGFNPRRVQGTATPEGDSDTPGSNGYGIVQWTPGTKILQAAQQTNSSPGDLGFQLSLLWGQLTGTPPGDYISEKTAGDAVKAATTLQAATSAFMLKYERPADKSEAAQTARNQFSIAILAELGSTTPGVGPVSSGSSCPATNTSADAAIVGDPYTSSVDVACAANTDDLGVQDAYVKGVKVPMRLCGLTNMPSTGTESTPGGQYYVDGANNHTIVNSRVSGAWYALAEAARTAGIHLSSNSSFRTMAHQQDLCSRNADCRSGGSNSVAQPGYSSHQAGVAIDFSGMDPYTAAFGLTCANRQSRPGNKAWEWLVANAAQFGFRQYANEAWHWDALTESRC